MMIGRSLVFGAAILATVVSAISNSSWQSERWDVIVVGSGPAGIIVADRMSEAGKKTLLLEGGNSSYYVTGGTQSPTWLVGQNLSRVDVPGLYKSIFSEQGDLTCQNYTTAFVGCTVGGSSAINAGLFFQPPASDFDDYFPEGWKYADVIASINRVYEHVPSDDVYAQNGQFYLQSGYDAARKWLVDGAGYRDVDLNRDANNKTKVFGRPIFNYIKGERGGPVRTYLQDALTRSNFWLQTDARVLRVARNGSTATGVVLARDNSTVALAEGGRVILSAGAMQSPQILMYSGIGDPELHDNLSAAGILDAENDWINNTAVGAGLFDNPNTFIELEGATIQSYVYNYTSPAPEDAKLYLESRSGPYSFASQTSAFWDYIDNPDGTRTGCQGTIDSAGFGEYMGNNAITLNVYGTSGLKSSGRIVLNEKFLPGNSPEVYYSDPQDADAIAQFIYNIFQALPGSGLTPLNLQANWTKTQIRDYITSETQYTRGAVQHWSSSCRIGSCVDRNAQVVGTTNIHVVDASILEPLTVNPQVNLHTTSISAQDFD
jgi:cellobiose dehydrogenase (acceptor)